MTWPRLRGSPDARAESAASERLLKIATPSATGSSAESRVMVSGAVAG